MNRKMSIKNIQIQELKIEPKHAAFADIPKTIYPDSINRKISFELLGLGTEFANAIRVCTMEEIEWKALEVDETLIKYEDPNREPDIIMAEFCKRISLIPIRQDISDDTKFSLQVANTGSIDKKSNPDVEYRIVYSGDLRRSGGSGGSGGSGHDLFDSRFRLAALSAGKVIEVNGIKVVKGYGYENAKFTTCSIEYKCLDYVDVYYLSAKDQINSFMTSLNDIRATPAGKNATANSRIIIIPDPAYVAFASAHTKERIKSNFDIVIEKSSIQPISSSIARPKHYYMSFTFFCNVDPKKILVQSLQTLKERIDRIRKVLQDFIVGVGGTSGVASESTISGVEKSFMEISIPDTADSVAGLSEDKRIPSILIRGEDHVIGNLIVKTVLDLDPKTPMINYKIIHPSNRSVVINVMHPQPIKIVIDALNTCYDIFDKLQKQVTG